MTVATYPGGGSAATKSWKHQGRLDVAASGPALYDFEARELSPGLGAFTGLDSLLGSAGNPAQLNRYVYVAGNPTSFVDPDGHRITAADCDYAAGESWALSSGELMHNPDGSLAGVYSHSNTPPRRSTTSSSNGSGSKPGSSSETPTSVAPRVPVGMGGLAASYWAPSVESSATKPDTTGAHLTLATCGLVPVWGIGCDVADAVTYAGEGDWGSAAFSVFGIIPLIGDLAGAAKVAKAGAKAVHVADEALESSRIAVRAGDDVVATIRTSARGGVYTLTDASTGQIVRTGRTNDSPGWPRVDGQ